MARSFNAIDVGTSKICAIVAEIDEAGAMSTLGVGVVPSQGLHKGVVVNIDGAKRAIQEAVRIAQSACGIAIKSAYVSISGNHLRSINTRSTVGIFRRSRLVSSGDIREAIQASTNISVPSDRRLIRVTPRSYILDGQVEVKDPIGMHGFRLDADVHLVTGTVTSVRNLVGCIHSIGIDVEDLVPGSIASSEAVLTEEEEEIGVLLADIGCGTTDIAMFKGGSICHSAVLPVGGHQVTRDLSIGLGIPYGLAEEAKIRFGNVTPGYEERESITLGENGYTVSYQELHHIIFARVEEIFRLVIAEISSYEQEIIAPAGLVLTGGTANLAGIEILGQETMGFPVRVRMPHGIAGKTDTLYDPAYAASVGLLLWGAKYGGRWKSPEISPPTLGDVFRKFFRR